MRQFRSSPVRFIAPLLASCVAAFAIGAFAQMPPDGHRPPPDIAKLLNLDAARAQQVQSIMQSTRQQAEAIHAQMKALHEGTQAQLAKILTPDELKKLQGLHRPAGGMRPMGIAQRLGLDPVRSQQVEAIMKAAREQGKVLHAAMRAASTDAERADLRLKLKALRDSTKSQLAGVLTPDEMKKLQDGMHHRPLGNGGPRGDMKPH
jgi:Spy/CpxP family protein refolding chaperone